MFIRPLVLHADGYYPLARLVGSLEAALPSGDSILLDTTAVIAYFAGTEPASPVATHIIDEFVAGGRNVAFVSTLTALECLVAPIRRKDETLYRDILLFFEHTRHLKMASATFQVAQEAAKLRATYDFKAPDALIIATGMVVPVQHLVSNDRHWKRLARGTGAPTVCYLEDHLPIP